MSSYYSLRCQCDKFDVKLNSDHIGQCLARLADLYKKNSMLNKNEPEMMTYNVLYKIGMAGINVLCSNCYHDSFVQDHMIL